MDGDVNRFVKTYTVRIYVTSFKLFILNILKSKLELIILYK